MTAGGGIAHSEVSPPPHGPVLHGAQLWVALPDAERAVAPAFEHHAGLPVLTAPGLRAHGAARRRRRRRAHPARAYTPIVGVDVELDAGADARCRSTPEFEHAVLTVSGTPEVDGGPLAPGSLRLPRLRPVVAAPVRRRARAPARCWAASRSRSRS